MDAIRVKRRIESENVYLPELRPWKGADVEIIVLRECVTESAGGIPPLRYPLRGSVSRYEEPFEPVAAHNPEDVR